MTRTLLLAAAALALASPSQAAGTGTPTPQTPTSQTCEAGQVWDERSKACVDARDARLTDDDRLDAARELAAHGRPADALRVLAAHGAADAPEVLTLRGFATRRAGDWAGGVALYRAALALDPDHWQARSYLGLGLLERGDRDGALAELAAIRAGGGRGTYPERELAAALDGAASGYGGETLR